jgi:hypothetical protein
MIVWTDHCKVHAACSNTSFSFGGLILRFRCIYLFWSHLSTVNVRVREQAICQGKAGAREHVLLTSVTKACRLRVAFAQNCREQGPLGYKSPRKFDGRNSMKVKVLNRLRIGSQRTSSFLFSAAQKQGT